MIKYIICRELDVDGCGGNAEEFVVFPEGLTDDEANQLHEMLVLSKKVAVAEQGWFDTESIVRDALTAFERKTGKCWQVANLATLEF